MKIEEKLDLSHVVPYTFPRNTLCKNITKRWKYHSVGYCNSQISIDNLMLSNFRIYKTPLMLDRNIMYLVVQGICCAGISVDKTVTIDECENVVLSDDEKKEIVIKLEKGFEVESKFVAEQKAFFEKQPHKVIEGMKVIDAIAKLTEMGLGWTPPLKKRDVYYDESDSNSSGDD